MVSIAGQTEGIRVADEGGEANEVLLLRRIANQDRKAFESFYYDYTPRIGNFMMKMLKSPELVDEAINEVMMTVWQSAERFDPAQGKLSTWLFGIAHNKALKVLERQRRHWREELLDQNEPDPAENEWDDITAETASIDPHNPERTILGWEMGDILVWALEHLTPEHRAVLELVFTESYAYRGRRHHYRMSC